MKHNIPRFAIPLFNKCTTAEEKKEFIANLQRYKENEFTVALVSYLEKVEQDMALEDEKVYSTWFETKYRKAQRTGRRKQSRHIRNDLT